MLAEIFSRVQTAEVGRCLEGTSPGLQSQVFAELLGCGAVQIHENMATVQQLVLDTELACDVGAC